MSIAVVIPAYNSMRHLKETLDSVFAQTLQPDEIIVVDDGSSDDTPQFAESYGPRVKVFRRANSGQGATRNFGAANAHSEWLALLDHDDIWLPEKLERQMAELASHPEADACFTGRTRFAMDGDRMRVLSQIPAPPPERIPAELLCRATFTPSAAVIRRSTYLAIGGFDTTLRIGEDWNLWLRLMYSGVKFASCPGELLLYRLHPGNTSGDGMRMLQDNEVVFRSLVLPHLSGVRRLLAINRFWGENQSYVAGELNSRRDSRCLALMTKSILHLPFGDPYRYRALLGMLYRRLTGRFNSQVER